MENNRFVKEGEGDMPWPVSALIALMTLGTAVTLFYDDMYHRGHMVNRRRLLKYIERGEASLVSFRVAMNEIQEYIVEIGGKHYRVWVWGDDRVSMSSEDYDNWIGLFLGSWTAARLNRRLKGAVTSLAGDEDLISDHEWD